MQFKVPQFLDIEDKIFGPFTFKQFVYLAGGAGLCFIIYKVLGLLLGFIPILIMAGIATALAFYRPNNKPLLDMIESGFRYLTQSKLYIWKNKGRHEKNVSKNIKPMEIQRSNEANSQKLNRSKLQDLAWSLDVLDLKKDDNS